MLPGSEAQGAISSSRWGIHQCCSAPGPRLGAALAPTSLKPGKGLRLFPATRSDASPGPDCSDLAFPSPPGCWAISQMTRSGLTKKRESGSSWPHPDLRPSVLLKANLEVSLSAYRLWLEMPRVKGQGRPQAQRLWKGLGRVPRAWVCGQSQLLWVERESGGWPSSLPW